MKKIYDCFCYFNEDLLLTIRLETLWNHVDFFVIVESAYTISGNEKSINFNLEKFKKYQSKIRYLLIKEYPFALNNPWENERFQRNYIENGLYDAQPDDWVLISDLDEIPRPECISLFKASQFLRGDFEQNYYSYFLNNMYIKNGSAVFFYGSKITTFNNFKLFFHEAERVRSYKSSGWLRQFKRWWFKKTKVQIIKNGGWHFTWVTSIEKIILKLESYAHQEYNKPEYKDSLLINKKITSGYDIIIPNIRYKPQKIDNQFPPYIIKHQNELIEWIAPIED